eukprot:scaffold20057_cov61-Phaeocystis_antarctica.AAC.6
MREELEGRAEVGHRQVEHHAVSDGHDVGACGDRRLSQHCTHQRGLAKVVAVLDRRAHHGAVEDLQDAAPHEGDAEQRLPHARCVLAAAHEGELQARDEVLEEGLVAAA